MKMTNSNLSDIEIDQYLARYRVNNKKLKKQLASVQQKIKELRAALALRS